MKPLLAVLTLVPSLALGQGLEVSRRASMAGKNEISAQMGFQASMGGGTPSGAKLMIDYSRHLKGIAWFNARLAPTFSALGGRVCVDRFGVAYDCGLGIDGNGHAIDALVGVKLKWTLQRAPLVPYVGLQGGVVGIFNRPAGDNGVAVVFRPAGGIRYFFTPHVAVGGEMAFALGGAFYGASCPNCNNAHNEFYRAFDMSVGAEFVF